MTEKAWVARGWANRSKAYHTNPNCPSKNKTENLEKTTVKDAKARQLRLCSNCDPDHDTKAYDTSYQRALKEAAKSD